MAIGALTGKAAEAKLEAKLATTKTPLDDAVHGARQRVETLKQEADGKSEALKLQFSQAKGDLRARIEDRMKPVSRA